MHSNIPWPDRPPASPPASPWHVGRDRRNSEAAIAAERREGIRDSVRYHAARRQEIPARLAELDREWDLDRAIAGSAAAVTLAGLALTALVDRRFVALPAMVGGFLLQYAIRGRCPPATLLRRIGFRTAREICEEREGLKVLEGQYRAFGNMAPTQWSVTTVSLHEGVEA